MVNSWPVDGGFIYFKPTVSYPWNLPYWYYQYGTHVNKYFKFCHLERTLSFSVVILLCLYREPQPKKTQKAPHRRPQTPSAENPNPKKLWRINLGKKSYHKRDLNIANSPSMKWNSEFKFQCNVISCIKVLGLWFTHYGFIQLTVNLCITAILLISGTELNIDTFNGMKKTYPGVGQF